MRVSEVGEKIKVGAVFDGARVTPKWFLRGRVKTEVRSVEHTWKIQEGQTPFLFFAVTDGTNVFELCLNQKTLAWRLEKVYTEG